MDSIINGLFSLIGVVIGGVISYFVAKDAKETTRLKGEIDRLMLINDQYKSHIKQMGGQIIAYWNLEKEYLQKLSNFSDQAEKTTMIESRDKIETTIGTRTTMTEKQVNDILMKL